MAFLEFDYFASAALAHGYFEGTIACKQALSLATGLDAQTELTTAQRLTRLLPEQREAWEGLVKAAKRVGDEVLAHQAQERITLMQSTQL